MHVIDQQCNGKNRFKLRIMERGWETYKNKNKIPCFNMTVSIM
jgi:hypothetical protein